MFIQYLQEKATSFGICFSERIIIYVEYVFTQKNIRINQRKSVNLVKGIIIYTFYGCWYLRMFTKMEPFTSIIRKVVKMKLMNITAYFIK